VSALQGDEGDAVPARSSRDLKENVGRDAQDAKEQLKGDAREAQERLKDGAQQVKEQAGDKAGQFADRARETKEQVLDRFGCDAGAIHRGTLECALRCRSAYWYVFVMQLSSLASRGALRVVPVEIL
jgi:hypothetical protein